jgi:cation transporter-like permease
LLRAAKRSNRTSGRVDAVEDPRDVYRVWLPKGKKLTARVTADGAIALKLERSTASTVRRALRPDLLATSGGTSTGTTLTYRNSSAGRFALLVVSPATTNTTTYAISVGAR